MEQVLTHLFKTMEQQERFIAANDALVLSMVPDGKISMIGSEPTTSISSKRMPSFAIKHKCQSIQVATFANPKNTERASLPMQRMNLTKVKKLLIISGKSYQIVLVD